MKNRLIGKTKSRIRCKGNTIYLITQTEYELPNPNPMTFETGSTSEKIYGLDLTDSLESLHAEKQNNSTTKSSKSFKTKETKKAQNENVAEEIIQKLDATLENQNITNESPKLDSNTFDVRDMFCKVNNVFEKRSDIIREKLPTDFELRIKIFQDWANVLNKIAKTIIERTINFKTKIEQFTDEPDAVSDTELNFEHDRNELIKAIQKRVHTRKWDFKDINLKLVPLNEILNVKSDHLSDGASSSQGQRSARGKCGRQRNIFTKPQI